jgi:4-amino-4-deoxy-L-arabinose transferase-like glycosyltransferase
MTDAASAVDARAAAVRTFRPKQLWILVGITLLAAGLRLHRLGDWAFWVDEAHTFRDVSMPREQFWQSNVSNYPLGYVLTRWLLDLGILRTTGEGWLRLPFAFFGILTVPALAVFGRSVVGRRAALLAAGFLAISPWHLYWSQNARGYAPTAFFALLAAFAAHRAARHRSVVLGGLAVLGAFLAALGHPSGALVFVGLAAFFVSELVGEPDLRRAMLRPPVLVLGGLLALAAALWLGPTVLHASTEKPDFSLVHLVQTFAWFLGPPFVVAAVGGGLVMVLRAPRRETAFLITWVLGPLVALVVVGSTLVKATAQYGLVILPALFLLASRLIVELADAIGEQKRLARLLRWSLPFVLGVTLLGDAFLYFTKRNGERPLWRDAAHFVSGEAVGPIEVWSTNEPSMRYYLDRGSYWGQGRDDVEVQGMADWLFAKAGGGAQWFEARVAAAHEAGRSLYFVITEPELEEWDRDGSFDRALRAGSHQLRRYPCWVGPKDMTVLVYKVPERRGLGEVR